MRQNRSKLNAAMFLLSPSGISVIALFPLLISLLIPYQYYVYYMNEEYYLRDDIYVPLFYGTSIFFFWIGARFSERFSSPGPGTGAEKKQPLSFWLAFSLLLIALILNIVSLRLLLQNSPGLLNDILDGYGDLAKKDINADGALANAQPFMVAVLTWGLFRYFEHKAALPPLHRFTLLGLIITCFVVAVLVSVAKVARYEIVPLFITLIVVNAYHRARGAVIPLRKILFYLVAMALFFIVLFSAFSLLRGATDSDRLVSSLLGYCPVAFNHLHQVLSGSLVFTYAGRLYYLFNFISSVPLFGTIFGIRQLLDFPEAIDVLKAELLDTGAAGLSPGYNWITAFGYVYADIGLLCFVYIFVMGCLFGLSWSSFKSNKTLGITTYPVIFGVGVLFFTSNLFSRPTIFTAFGTALLILILERTQRIMFRK